MCHVQDWIEAQRLRYSVELGARSPQVCLPVARKEKVACYMAKQDHYRIRPDHLLHLSSLLETENILANKT